MIMIINRIIVADRKLIIMIVCYFLGMAEQF
jgi:hypothetical protein